MPDRGNVPIRRAVPPCGTKVTLIGGPHLAAAAPTHTGLAGGGFGSHLAVSSSHNVEMSCAVAVMYAGQKPFANMSC